MLSLWMYYKGLDRRGLHSKMAPSHWNKSRSYGLLLRFRLRESFTTIKRPWITRSLYEK